MTLVVQLMGAVRLVRDGQPVDIGGPKQQAVLAVLALSAGRRVSTDRLIDLVWHEDPPVTARRTVQSYVASLRSALGATLEPSQNGYTLSIDRAHIDLLRFDDRVTDLLGDVGLDPDAKAHALEDMLSTWEAPLDGLRDSSRLGELVVPFEELRFQAVEGLVAAQVAGTRSGDAVKMLEGLVREHPTRENLWLELARGLNRLGRRDAALNAIQRAREALREHLGVDPSALLSALETNLLIGQSHAAPPESASRPGNLPKPLSSFIGRADEVDDIAAFLTEARLVTLRGLGGIGKTSLALQLAANHAAEYEDGVWFIDLAYVAPAAAMSERFLLALGLQPQADNNPLDQLLTQLRPLRALLVVDNCEQQLDEIAPLIEQIVRGAPNIYVLATSRESLAVSGEALWQVGPLVASAAVELFAERARLVRHDFELGDTNRGVVESICQRLDGIPLAIELAAARLNVLAPDQILLHLDDRFALLRGNDPERANDDRTLRSALDWSYGLVDEPDRVLLRRLVVFPADFTLEAVQHICATGESVVEVVNSMGRLVDASLVVFEPNDNDPRYRLLETVREYAAERLSASELDEVALQHVTYYLDAASQIAAQYQTDHVGALRAGDRDLDNFRAAMAHAFTHSDPQQGLSITRHLRLYFIYRRLYREFLRWLQAGIAQADPKSDEAMFAIANALVAAMNADEGELADRLAKRVEKSIDLAQDPVVRARLLSSSGAHLMDIDPRRADMRLASATALVKHIDTTETLACIINRLFIGWRTGDLPGAQAMIVDLEGLPDGPNVRRVRILVEIQAAACTGRWEEVIDASVEHFGLDEDASADMLGFRAEALGALGRTDDAIATLDQLDQLERREDLARTSSQIIRATTELRRGDAATAKSLLAESAASYMRESERMAGFWFASLAGAAVHRLGEDDAAARLFGYAQALGDEYDIQMRMSERRLVEDAAEECRATLGPDRFDELANVGASLDWVILVELLSAT